MSLALSLIPTTRKIPGVLEMPKHIITNKVQWMAGVTRKGLPVQPQIPQYTGNPLLHSI